MLQCKDCDLYHQESNGKRTFLCDPFQNIKEPECLQKWQLLRLDMLLQTFASMTAMQARMAPLQDKIFKYIKREIDDMEQTDKWKYEDENDQHPEFPSDSEFQDPSDPDNKS